MSGEKDKIIGIVIRSGETKKLDYIEVNHGEYEDFIKYKIKEHKEKDLKPKQKKKIITGTLNFVLSPYVLNDFLREMDNRNVEVINVDRRFVNYTVTVKGFEENLDHARWFFKNYGASF